MTNHSYLSLIMLMGATAAFGHTLEGERVRVDVDVTGCRWSAWLKGTQMSLKSVHFLSSDNPAGWNVSASPSRDENSGLGSFTAVTLHGTKAGQLDFDYHIWVSKTGNDIIVRLDRTNNTGGPVEVVDMDYIVAREVRLGGTAEEWMTFGTPSSYKGRYRLTNVSQISEEQIYETCQLARNRKTGGTILMGHLTVRKGHSRFAFIKGERPEIMKMRAYCNYNVTMPAGKSFEGELLLVSMNDDGLLALEHMGDLIGIANDVRLKQRKPIDLEDRGLLAGTHCRFMNWMSGSQGDDAHNFIQRNALDKFYYAVATRDPEFGRNAQWGLYYQGGGGLYSKGTIYPAKCYLPVLITWPFGNPRENNGGRVLDFSNPLTVKLERERVFETFADMPDKVHWAHLDYADMWDKWPGQFDPFMSAAETWRAGAAPWREIHEKAPRLRNRACMTKVDFSYGFVDISRTSNDADSSFRALLNNACVGTAARFFYNGRVYWNDADNFHVYRYKNGEFSYNQGKVSSNFRAIAGSTTLPSEKFDVDYPEDRLELLKRVSPPTEDVSYPADLFERIPAAVWSMPIGRPFGTWSVLAVFNYGPVDPRNSTGTQTDPFSVSLDAARDLRLDPNKEYVVYEFWSRKLLGTFRGKFTSRPVKAIDCDIYSIVEKQNHPTLISTSRHVRQMAVDIKDLTWSAGRKELRGLSRSVSGDPYQLRIYVPNEYTFDRVELEPKLGAKSSTDGNLLTIDYTSPTAGDVAWRVRFKERRP